MIGRVLGRRYEVLERLGGGGMALVYRGRDRLLNRTVAIKVMRPQLSGDDEFIRRFKREAESAAGLSHPNIVGIYDVGQEEDIYYIVQEYVEGRTLKDKIAEEGPLSAEEAVVLAIDIGDALAYAHRHKIVHRDIKPQNILISKEGRVKVTDFGVARAATTVTLTNTGNVVGSVHYFSPEQARGGYSDEKSDIYSLGVVLFEMVTGQVPFEGETAITVALKHVQEQPRSVLELNPDASPELDHIVQRAMRKVPAERYPSVEHMVADLERVSRGEPASADGADLRDSPTMVMKPVRGVPPKSGNGRPTGHGRRPKGGMSPAAKVLIPVGVALFLFAIGLKVLIDWFNVPTVIVPNVVGKRVQEAEQVLRDSRLTYTTIDSIHAPEQAGTIIWQDPPANDQVRAGRTIELKVSLGPEMVTVPDVVGQHIRDAEIKLGDAKLSIGARDTKYDNTIQKDYVISQNPRAPTVVRAGEKVDLVISLGPSPTSFAMPNLMGETLANARQRITGLGLLYGGRDTQVSAQPIGTVLSHNPPPGRDVKPGDLVTFVVSRGGFTTENTFTHNFTVPTDGPAQQEIRIELTDAIGTETIYQKTHAAGEALYIPVRWVGRTGVLRTYANGVLIGELPLKAGS